MYSTSIFFPRLIFCAGALSVSLVLVVRMRLSGLVLAGSPSQVRLCLQFVEGLCARAEEYSRRDASETWKPLEKTISRL